MKRVLTLLVIGFLALCGWLVAGSGLAVAQQAAANEGAKDANIPVLKDERFEAGDVVDFRATGGPGGRIVLGAKDPNTEDPDTGFKFQLELSSKGAAIEKATFSDGGGKGFDDRDPKDPQPLVMLSPVNSDILSMANREFVLVGQQRQLDLWRLHWKSLGVDRGDYGSQVARFEAIVETTDGDAVVKLTKTYKVSIGSYLLDSGLTIENLSDGQQKVRFNLAGPVGIGREGVRSDMRKVVGGFRNPNGEIKPTRLEIGKFEGKKSFDEKQLEGTGNFLWAAVVNKYFAAILVPVPEEGQEYCNWLRVRSGRFYNPDARKNSGDENIGVYLGAVPTSLAPTGQVGSMKTYDFQVYLGPKDKSLFDKDKQYRELGFVHAIDFLGCCCPASIIRPLAFGILALMKWMYGFIGNYGLVIIILVFMIRIVIHPLTKKSQISMSKMSKLAPRMEEIKKKYANNKAELNKQMMALYKEQGASPVMGMLPMMVQMPVWIALWSAVYASIELRGAPFLPFWITDLSVPDALVRFSTVTIPLLGWKVNSLNLLPILMGIAFYLQQKLMPSQAAAANPQAAQQQKMMMIMMPLMFPLLLYNAPSGVSLYIMASTFAGVIEQYVIRKHVREKEEAESKGLVAATSKTGGKVKKKKPKPFYRMH
jgi:YidC/Oxa1 family membrane protein insertase